MDSMTALVGGSMVRRSFWEPSTLDATSDALTATLEAAGQQSKFRSLLIIRLSLISLTRECIPATYLAATTTVKFSHDQRHQKIKNKNSDQFNLVYFITSFVHQY